MLFINEHMRDFLLYFDKIDEPLPIFKDTLDGTRNIGYGEVWLEDADENAPSMMTFEVYKSSKTNCVYMSAPRNGEEYLVVVPETMFAHSPYLMEPRIHTKIMVVRQIRRHLLLQRPFEERVKVNGYTGLACQYSTEPSMLDLRSEDQAFFKTQVASNGNKHMLSAYFNSIFVALSNGGVNIKEAELDLECMMSHGFDKYTHVLKESIVHIDNPYIQKEMQNRIEMLYLRKDIKMPELPQHLRHGIVVEIY